MAMANCLKILLLWAGILVMAEVTTARYQQFTTARYQESETQAPPPLECSYTVNTSNSGFNITMNKNFTTGNYTININEKGRPDTGHSYSVQFSDEKSTHEIKHLKPCTEYEHDVAFNDAVGKKTPCTTQRNTTKTNEWNGDDIEDDSCMPGYVCYRSDWDISSSPSTSNHISCNSEKKEICVKLDYNDICTNLTKTFTSGNCNALNLTRTITADFLNPSEINQTSPTKLPAEIKTDLPQNCTNLKITYSCQEDGKPNELKNLTDLEPYTDYSCIGQIMENYVNIKNTYAIKFKIDCDLKMSIKETSVTNTSIDLSWTTASDKCEVVLPKPQFSYECSCKPTQSNEKPRTARAVKNPSGGISGGTCQIDGLKPDIDYNCEVHPIYNNDRKPAQNNVKRTRTKSGVPKEIKNLKTNLPEHNVIHATCDPPNDFNGPRKDYIARLYGGDVLIKTLNQTKCEFEFKALSYSTEYELKVTASNGHYEGKTNRASVTTSYDHKALIVRLVFFIMVSVAFAVVLYKIYTLRLRKSRNDADVDENAVIELVEIYANVPQSECRRRDTT